MTSLVLSALSVVLIAAVNCHEPSPIFRECVEGNTDAIDLLDVRLPDSGCHGPPCFMKEGMSHDVMVKFRVNKRFPKVKMEFGAQLHGFRTPIHFKTVEDACDGNDFDVSCPLEEGQVVTYNFAIEFPMGIAGIKAFAMVSFKEPADQRSDNTDKKHLCFSIPVQLTI